MRSDFTTRGPRSCALYETLLGLGLQVKHRTLAMERNEAQ